jgi:O-acetylhomoserine/O-acetylserine sulfhydrylase-like pyridoxal-dependent enzyme
VKTIDRRDKAVFIETFTKENQNVIDILVLAVAQMEGLMDIITITNNCTIM